MVYSSTESFAGDIQCIYNVSVYKQGRGRGNRREDSSGIEAYYRHSMVEDPWKELEEKYKERNKQD